MHACIHAPVYTNVHTHAHTLTHAHTHTRMHTRIARTHVMKNDGVEIKSQQTIAYQTERAERELKYPPEYSKKNQQIKSECSFSLIF